MEVSMKDTDAMGNAVTRKIGAFLAEKPVWVWWIFYVVATGVLFGVFSLAFYLLTIQWWVAVLILFVAGIVWGSIKHMQMKGKINAGEKKEKISA
jgi:uncharacterized membrane protein